MAASNRAQLITKLHTVLKKKYQAPPTQPTRPMLEHLLYACVLEDCPADLADEGFAKLEQDFFDWNEVRVTTVTELSHVLSRLPDPVKAARRLKENLQAVFEEFYTFELDHLKKENLGKAVNKFEKMPAMTPFVLGYTVQHGLGGHSIPVDFSAMMMMLATEIATQAEAKSGRVPGLERAIPKNKGIEFATLLHIAAVGLSGDLKDKKARETMDAVNKGSSQRLDDWIASKKAAKRRGVKRKAEAKAKAEADAKAAAEAARLAKIAAAEKAAKKAASKAAAKKKSTTRPEPVKSVSASTSKTAKSKSTKKVAVTAKKAAKKPAKKAAAASKKKPVKKSTAKKPTSKKSTSKKPATKKPTAKKSAAKKATATKSKSASKKASKKTAAKKSPAKKKPTKKKGVKKAASKKSSSRKLTKRKPR